MTEARARDASGPLWRAFSRHGATYLLGESAGRGLTYVVLILLAPLTPVEDFGYINLFITIVGLLIVLVGLGLPDAVLRFYFLDEPLPPVLGATILLIAMASAAFGGVVFAARGMTAEWLHVPQWLIVLSLVGAPLTAVRQVWLGVLRAQQRSRAYAVSRAVEPLLMIVALLPLALLAGGLGYRSVLAAYVGSTAAVALVGLGLLSRRPGVRWTLRPSRSLLSYSVPLIFHAVAMTGLATYDQIVVNQTLGSAATGVYAYAYRFGMGMFLVSASFSAAWAPLVFEKAGQEGGEGALGSVAATYGNVALVVAGALCLLLPPVARWVGGPEYRGAVRLIPIIVYAYLWVALYGLAAAYLVHERRTLAVALSSGAAFVTNAGLNYTLVPRFGLAAAAATTVASYALLFVLVWAQIRRNHPEVAFGRLLVKVLLFAPLPILVSRWLA